MDRVATNIALKAIFTGRVLPGSQHKNCCSDCSTSHIEFYCENCDAMICTDCITKHRTHNWLSTNEHAKKARYLLRLKRVEEYEASPEYELAKSRRTSVSQKIETLGAERCQLIKDIEEAEDKIKRCRDRLYVVRREIFDNTRIDGAFRGAEQNLSRLKNPREDLDERDANDLLGDVIMKMGTIE
jgi:hypothetical protein